MFSKLRMRMVLTNVITAGLIVIIIAVVAYVMIAGNISKQSQQILQLISADIALQSNGGDLSTDTAMKIMGGLYPYFIVQVDNNAQTIHTNFKTGISDDKLLVIAKTILAAEADKKKQISKITDETGRQKIVNSMMGATVIDIGSRSFRYSSIGSKNGASYLFFLDMSEERALLGRIAVSLAVCVAAGMALVFFGGLFLAGRSIKPIRLSWVRQRDFVADASHELRSPLAALRLSLDAVLARPESTIAEKQDFFTGMGEELTRMTRLVDDMLLIARADSGAVVFLDEAVNIAKTAESAVQLMQCVAEQKGIACTITIGAAPLVRGDGERLKQALLVLLDNAVKYTPEGGAVRVEVKYQQSRAVVEVSDTGIGIAREHWQGIFERFYRVDKARSRESGGQGLGLSIAKWIVEKHHGSITVNSEPGKGSTFIFTLPEAK